MYAIVDKQAAGEIEVIQGLTQDLMITAVLDTNVLASGFVRPEPPPGHLLLTWRARSYLLVVSEPILAELARTFEEPSFAQHLTPSQRLDVEQREHNKPRSPV